MVNLRHLFWTILIRHKPTVSWYARSLNFIVLINSLLLLVSVWWLMTHDTLVTVSTRVTRGARGRRKYSLGSNGHKIWCQIAEDDVKLSCNIISGSNLQAFCWVRACQIYSVTLICIDQLTKMTQQDLHINVSCVTCVIFRLISEKITTNHHSILLFSMWNNGFPCISI